MFDKMWQGGNLAVAFGAELVALGALTYWGVRTGDQPATKVALGIAAPALAATLWGLFAAPRAVLDIPVLAVATKIAVFGAATLALWQLGHHTAAVVFPIVVVVNLTAIAAGHPNPQPQH
jgi:hypothetical protein